MKPTTKPLPCPHCAGLGGLGEEGYRKAVRCLATKLLYDKYVRDLFSPKLLDEWEKKIGLVVERMYQDVRKSQGS